ncbi:acyltransferase [Nordella sp. HKS 07]|nr:acyltransferase [Nordella sp. HKS 07]
MRRHVGEKTFARGEAYHRDGRVVLLSLEPEHVLAQVEGSEDYQVEHHGRGKTFGGECSCPFFEDSGTCKHMVAVILAVNETGGDGKADSVGALSRIRDNLRKKNVDVLAEMIVKMAAQNPMLFRELDLAAAAALPGDGKELEGRLKKVIDNATRTRDYVDYRAAQGWAAGVSTALDSVASLLQGGQADVALKLAEHAIDRIEGAIGGIDDSDGHCGALMEQARDIHLEAARVAKPDPLKLARNLFARETESEYETFYRAADLYADILGKTGRAEYRRLANAAWEKLPPRSGRSRQRGEPQPDYNTLMGILDAFAEGDGDTQARIALREKDLSSQWDYLNLAEFCLAHGRKEEALRRAEEGLWIFEDEEPDERLVIFTRKLLEKAGRKDDMQALLQRAFEKAPSLELYKQLVKVGGAATQQSAVMFLETRATSGRRGFWHPASLLIDILMHEKSFDAAWAAVRKYGASAYAEDDLARKSEKSHPREALAVYAKRVEELVNAGGNPAYEQAAKLIARMTSLQGASEQAAYVAGLRQRFERKRNFMKLLG